MRNIYLSMLWIAFTIGLSACEDDSEGPVNNPPVANAGQDISISLGQEVTLNGSSSSDPDGDNLTYAWALKSKPDGSQSTLTDANSASAKFTPDEDGEYVAELTVSDGEGGTSKDEVKITVTATQAPDDGCRLVAFGIGDADAIYIYTRFEYNAAGYAVSATVDGDDYPTTYEYNSDNRMVRLNYQNDEGSSYSTYVYEDGLIIEETYVDENGAENVHTYTYDDQKRLIETRDEAGFKTVYTYDDRGNVIKEEFYGEDSGNTISTTYTYEDFDDKSNFFHAAIGLPHSETPFISNNNYGKTTLTDHRAGTTTVTNYTYEYNSSGYPTKVTGTDQDGNVEVATMEYEGCE